MSLGDAELDAKKLTGRVQATILSPKPGGQGRGARRSSAAADGAGNDGAWAAADGADEGLVAASLALGEEDWLPMLVSRSCVWFVVLWET